MIPSESERGRSDSEARTETCDAVSDLLPTPALLVAPTPPRNPFRSPLFSSLLFCCCSVLRRTDTALTSPH